MNMCAGKLINIYNGKRLKYYTVGIQLHSKLLIIETEKIIKQKYNLINYYSGFEKETGESRFLYEIKHIYKFDSIEYRKEHNVEGFLYLVELGGRINEEN